MPFSNENQTDDKYGTAKWLDIGILDEEDLLTKLLKAR